MISKVSLANISLSLGNNTIGFEKKMLEALDYGVYFPTAFEYLHVLLKIGCIFENDQIQVS